MTENTSCNICFSCPSHDDWDKNNILFNKICKTCNVVTCLYCTVKVENVCPICKKKNLDLSVNGLYTFITPDPNNYLKYSDMTDILVKSVSTCDKVLLSKVCNILSHFMDSDFNLSTVYPYIKACDNYGVIRIIIKECLIEPEYDDFYLLTKAIEYNDLECIQKLFYPEIVIPFGIINTVIKLCKFDVLKILIPSKKFLTSSNLKAATIYYKKSESEYEISHRSKILNYLVYINNQ